MNREFIKGKEAAIGEKRTWKGIEWVKTNHGWVKTKSSTRKQDQKPEVKPVKHSADELSTHAENTSTEQLKKVIKDDNRPQHIRDAAKRELERRTETDQKANNAPPGTQNKSIPKASEASKPKDKKPAFQYSPSDTLCKN